MGQCWIAFELSGEYLAASVFRFAENMPSQDVLDLYTLLLNDHEKAEDISTGQNGTMLFESLLEKNR